MSHIHVNLVNMNNKFVKLVLVLVNIDTFIIRVEFRFINIDKIRILT